MYEIPLSILFYLLAGLFAGIYLDKIMNTSQPFFTLSFILASFIYGIWVALKKLTK